MAVPASPEGQDLVRTTSPENLFSGAPILVAVIRILNLIALLGLPLIFVSGPALTRGFFAGLRRFRIVAAGSLVVGVHLGPSINPLRDTLRMLPIWVSSEGLPNRNRQHSCSALLPHERM